MAAITASLVKELRDETNLGMMDCKRALEEAQGDKQQAVKLLRERGLAIAGKKAGRSANQGVVHGLVAQGGKIGALIEVNCETDFVAKNEAFQAWVKDLGEKALEVDDGKLSEAVQDELTGKIAEIGENLKIRRNLRYRVEGHGAVACYIHLGGKIGVLMEAGCEKDETTAQDTFKELVKDITLHIAACNPQSLDRDGVPEDMVQAERAIYAKQVEDKPAHIVDKIVDGKLAKFYSQICLLEQGFVKDPDQSVTQVLKARSKDLGDTVTIRRFARFQMGEDL
jgi:elongation factor Ts